MRIPDLFQTATIGVTVNKMRSLLTMLGIIIGVAAVVMMTGIGQSMEGIILGQISVLGPKSMVLFPGNQGPEGGPASMRSDFDALKFSDYQAMQDLKTITSVAPIIFVSGKATYGRETMNPNVIGTTPNYLNNQNFEVVEGRPIDEADEESHRFVAIIGSDVKNELFPNSSPVGKRMEIADRRFTVVGVLDSVGTQFFQNADENIIIPFSVAKQITGQSYLNMMTYQAVDDFGIAEKDLRGLLRQRHGIIPPEDGSEENDDFLIRTAEQAQEILGTVSLSLTLFITMIATISLVVGGIGIMNIMLVAVTERTKEIGLRKAIGARKEDILYQFMIEAVYLTLIGGMLGVILGILFDAFVALIAGNFIEEYHFELSYVSIVVGMSMAMITGIAFGIYPARKAAQLSPMEALRYE